MSRAKLFVILGPEEKSYLGEASLGISQAITDSFIPMAVRNQYEIAYMEDRGERWYLRLREKAA